jgi:hypothetical protein
MSSYSTIRRNEKRRAGYLAAKLGLSVFGDKGGWIYSIPSLPSNV